jgi:hypothetical protein
MNPFVPRYLGTYSFNFGMKAYAVRPPYVLT